MTDNTDKHNSETQVDESTPVEDPGAGGDNEARTKVEQEVKQTSPPKNGIGGGGDAKLKDQDHHEDLHESEEETAKQSSPKKVSLFEAPVVVEGKRDRKKTARLSDAIHKETLDKEKEILKQSQDIPPGSGNKLVDIPYINYMLVNKMKNEDLNLLHRLFFNTPGPRHIRRKHIKDFCGYSFKEGSPDYEKKLDFLTRVFKEDMKKYILLPLGIKQESKREDTAKAVLDFCMKPEDRGVALPLTHKQRREAKKRKRSSSKKPKSSKSKKPKKDTKDSEDQEAGSGSDKNDDDDDDDDAKDTENSDNESDGDSPNVKTSDKEGDDDNEETTPKKVSKKTEKTPKKIVKKEATPKSATKKKELKKEKLETKKKTPKKKTDTKSPTPKNTKSPKKKQKTEAELSSLSSDSDSDDEPIVKKVKKSVPPTDDEVKDVVKKILDSSDLEDLSIRKVFQQVSAMYPEFDMSDKQKFIKKTVKELIN